MREGYCPSRTSTESHFSLSVTLTRKEQDKKRREKTQGENKQTKKEREVNALSHPQRSIYLLLLAFHQPVRVRPVCVCVCVWTRMCKWQAQLLHTIA